MTQNCLEIILNKTKTYNVHIIITMIKNADFFFRHLRICMTKPDGTKK